MPQFSAPSAEPVNHRFRISERAGDGQIHAYETASESAACAREQATGHGCEVVSVSHARSCPCRQGVAK